MHGTEEPGDGIIRAGQLNITVNDHMIIVSSTLDEEAPVHIYNTAGQSVSIFTIQPGETVETRVNSGVFIVNKKKVIVK